MTTRLIVEFLQFVEGQSQQSLAQLLDRVLQKSRLMTRAEAGTIFIVRARGNERWLEPASVQNDLVKVTKRDFIVPIGPGTIATELARRAVLMLWTSGAAPTEAIGTSVPPPPSNPWSKVSRRERPDGA